MSSEPLSTSSPELAAVLPAPPAAAPDAELAALGRSIASLLAHEGRVTTVFGAPVKLDTHTIVPVARVSFGGGAGGVRALGAAVNSVRGWLNRSTSVAPSRSLVGGGGLGVEIRPIGFLHEEDGRVLFTAIDGQRK